MVKAQCVFLEGLHLHLAQSAWVQASSVLSVELLSSMTTHDRLPREKTGKGFLLNRPSRPLLPPPPKDPADEGDELN